MFSDQELEIEKGKDENDDEEEDDDEKLSSSSSQDDDEEKENMNFAREQQPNQVAKNNLVHRQLCLMTTIYGSTDVASILSRIVY